MYVENLQKSLVIERLKLLSIDYIKDMKELYSEYNNLTKQIGKVEIVEDILHLFEKEYLDFTENDGK